MRPESDMGVKMRWFFGKVEDRDDPDKLGRVRVRAFGIHSTNKALVPTDTLPWAPVNMPATSASHAGVGESPTGILVGSMVWGFFMDGDSVQQPVVMGTWWGMPGGTSDVSPIVTGDETLPKGDAPLEPPNTSAAQYPYNKVTTTESGHVIEIDDTPDATRLSWFHKSGTYQEFTHDGDGVLRVVRDGYDITVGDKTIYVGGDCKIVVGGNVEAKVAGDIDAQAEGAVYITSETAIKGIAPVIEFTEASVDVDTSVIGNFTAMSREGYIVAYDDVEYEDVPPEIRAQFPVPPSSPPRTRVDEVPTSPGPSRGRAISCLDISFVGNRIPRGHAIYSRKLSPRFTVGSLSTNAFYSHQIQAQAGLDVGDVICNLKALAENVLEPLKRRYPTLRVTSGFRPGGGRSQHERGQAADLQSGALTNRQHLEIAQWIAANLPVDQLIFEHSNATGKVWIHVSYNRGRASQRRDVKTMLNQQFTRGLRLHH